jgi:hypothetical protein
MVLSNWKPIVLPEATETVAVAAPGVVLHLTSFEVTLVTGELLIGMRTAAVDVVLPAIRLCQMSERIELSERPKWEGGNTNSEQIRSEQGQ